MTPSNNIIRGPGMLFQTPIIYTPPPYLGVGGFSYLRRGLGRLGVGSLRVYVYNV